MEWYSLWRLLKWIGLLMWGMGLYRVSVQPKQTERLKGLYGFAVFGFALTWMSGWLMMKHLGYTLGATWISNAMLFGLLSMVGTFLRAFSTQNGKLYNAIIWVGLALSVASMVVRNGDIAAFGLVGGVLFCGLMTMRLEGGHQDESEELIDAEVIQGFKWMAWVEGLTVLVLFLLYLPAKKLMGINLDGGTGMIGWTHGVFVILYVLSLTFTFRKLGWSWMQYVAGGLSSFFPFGTFIFERKVLRVKEES